MQSHDYCGKVHFYFVFVIAHFCHDHFYDQTEHRPFCLLLKNEDILRVGTFPFQAHVPSKTFPVAIKSSMLSTFLVSRVAQVHGDQIIPCSHSTIDEFPENW